VSPTCDLEEHSSCHVFDRRDEGELEGHPGFGGRAVHDLENDPFGTGEADRPLHPKDPDRGASAASDAVGANNRKRRGRDLHHVQTHIGGESLEQRYTADAVPMCVQSRRERGDAELTRESPDRAPATPLLEGMPTWVAQSPAASQRSCPSPHRQ
jgi:hypothetical protein